MIDKDQIVIPLISAAAAALLNSQATPATHPIPDAPEDGKVAICPWLMCQDHRTVITIPIVSQDLQYTSWSRTGHRDNITPKSLFD
jgi:hypothetical protein